MHVHADKIRFDAEPQWGPLASGLALPHAPKTADLDDFMFMGEIETDKGPIFMYKHRDTRQYLNINWDGDFFAYAPDGLCELYEVVTQREAMNRCFPA